MSEAKECFAKIVEATTSSSGVTLGASKKGFGSFALCAGGKIFAMISTRDEFVVKLPRARVDALVASGVGVRFDPAHGRMMKEWLVVSPAFTRDWLLYAREAMKFVGAKNP
jgi:hypothetical protein